MADTVSKYLEQFLESLQAWTDERFASRRNLQDLAMFHLYLVNLAEASGWAYDGHSWNNRTPMGCLTVRATIDGVPLVVFTSARSSMEGIGVFMRKLDADLLEWRPDRFRS